MNTTTSTIYTLSLHDALPIYENERVFDVRLRFQKEARDNAEKIGDILIPFSTGKKIPLSEIATIEYLTGPAFIYRRSEEHTSELQSRPHLVCRLLLEKKKTII